MSITRPGAVRATVAVAAALLAAGLATSASAQQTAGLTGINVAAMTESGGGSGKTAQPAAGGEGADRIICVRGQRVMSRITQDFCRTESDWERRGGLLPKDH